VNICRDCERFQLSRTRGFTLIELLVVMSIIGLLIAILLPALGAARRTWRRTQNSAQIKGIHESIVARAGGGNYVGLSADGVAIEPRVEGRFKLLLDEQFFPPKYLISPSEDKPPWTSGPFLPEHYSFTMLGIASGGDRRNQWKGGNAALAPVLSDRGIDNGSGTAKSIHTDPEADIEMWNGSVCWNDNHVSWEQSRFLTTSYPPARYENDDLFTAVSHDDAYLPHVGK